jgi:choice-of-anchor A domain-containing protein
VNHTSAFAGVRGNLLYNTATDLPPFSGGFSIIPGIYREHVPNINWSAAKSYFETLSTTYSPANVAANCTQPGMVTNTGPGSFALDAQNSTAVVVFDLSPFAGTLTSAPIFNFKNVGNAAAILVLYPGAAVTFSGGSISIDGVTATAPYAGAEKDLIEKTLWNFYQATTFNFSAYAILGSVLAPFTTTVTLSGGQMNGQTILAGNITQNGGFECHNFCFTGDLSTLPTATAAATQPTCVGNVPQNNGGITISGFTAGQRYQ